MMIWLNFCLWALTVSVCVRDLQASARRVAFWLFWCLCVSSGQQYDVTTMDTHRAQTNKQLHFQGTHLQAAGWTRLLIDTRTCTHTHTHTHKYNEQECKKNFWYRCIILFSFMTTYLNTACPCIHVYMYKLKPSWLYRCRGLQPWLLWLHSAQWNTAMHSCQTHKNNNCTTLKSSTRLWCWTLNNWCLYRTMGTTLNESSWLLLLQPSPGKLSYFVMTCNRWSVSTASRTFSG